MLIISENHWFHDSTIRENEYLLTFIMAEVSGYLILNGLRTLHKTELVILFKLAVSLKWKKQGPNFLIKDSLYGALGRY